MHSPTSTTLSSPRRNFYKWGTANILQWCLSHEEGERVLNGCHVGAYDNHLLGIVSTHNIIHARYFWPYLFHDYIHAIKWRVNCQIFVSKIKPYPIPLLVIISIDPFYK